MSRTALKMSRIPVVDVFAGPGGLSEGFAAYHGSTVFDIALSIEKNPAAHRTLELRSFFRQFPQGKVPEIYYRYIRGEGVAREQLFAAHPEEASRASEVAWLAELGKEPLDSVLARVEKAVNRSRHWVLVGGPPCQAYSVIGRARMKGMESFTQDRRHTLYQEYLKIVAAFRPTVFVMENVKGILSSWHNEERIFARILADMRDPWDALGARERREIPAPDKKHSYKIYSFAKPVVWEEQLGPVDYVIEAERYGIPQRRHRVILLGIRSDYDIIPPTLDEAPAPVSVRDVLEGMPPVRSRLSRGGQDGYVWVSAIRKGFTRRFIRMIPHQDLREAVEGELGMLNEGLSSDGRFIPGEFVPRKLGGWLADPAVGGIVQHEPKAHMAEDLRRYLFAACYAGVTGVSPKLDEFPSALWPRHSNAVPDDTGKVADFRDRFRVQVWDQPATTITSHIRKDGHYFIHPDPIQCRSLTVREAARLQTFPDNYFFEGNRTEQFEQVGNAVPPFLAYQLADVVAAVLEQCADTDARSLPAVNVKDAAVLSRRLT